MHLHPFTIESLANELSNELVNKRLVDAFTTDKHTLYLIFSSISIKVNFYQGEAFFQFPARDKLQKKNRLKVFNEIQGLLVREVKSYPYERIFRLILEGNKQLTFFLFGKFSQVAFHTNTLESYFPVDRKPIDLKEFKPFTIQDVDFTINGWEKEFKFLSQEQLTDFQKVISQHSKNEAINWLEQEKAHFLTSEWVILKNERAYTLAKGGEEGAVATFNSTLQALNEYSRLYLAFANFMAVKQSQIAHKKQLVKKTSNRVKSLQAKIEKLKNATTYKDKADLLMAYMHLVNEGDKSVTLTSFNGDKDITIKLNKSLTPQQNAARYYRKAKNQQKEVTFMEGTIAHLKETKQRLEEELERLQNETNFKQLQKIQKETATKKQVRLPYLKRLIDGFEVRIGRSAKDNDELLRVHSAKQDLWLHAKDVSGSHVIIRNPEKRVVPTTTLEKVAALAAHYSKAKNEGLAAVIYTERKFVRKPKGAHPGAVVVDKEEVILVEPTAI
jgi:predicted ribosome quality control (RQC) complex YloA/Tae2 family protein